MYKCLCLLVFILLLNQATSFFVGRATIQPPTRKLISTAKTNKQKVFNTASELMSRRDGMFSPTFLDSKARELFDVDDVFNAEFYPRLPHFQRLRKPFPNGPQDMPVDLVETNKTYKIFVDLPGVERSDIDISLTGKALKISGVRKASYQDGDGHKVHREERVSKYTTRTIRFPDDADRDNIHAESKNGVLEITLYKLHAQPHGTKRIAVLEGLPSEQNVSS
jgi:HSP20 family protein